MEVKTKKYKWVKWLLIGLGGILIISSFFGGREYSKRFWEREIAQRDSLINESQTRQDSLLFEIGSFEETANELSILIQDLEQRNYRLYANLKRQERLLYVIDTSFVRNAERIADSADRYYRRTNDIR